MSKTIYNIIPETGGVYVNVNENGNAVKSGFMFAGVRVVLHYGKSAVPLLREQQIPAVGKIVVGHNILFCIALVWLTRTRFFALLIFGIDFYLRFNFSTVGS